jgi:hypothetical protein
MQGVRWRCLGFRVRVQAFEIWQIKTRNRQIDKYSMSKEQTSVGVDETIEYK